jgi:hypothetical protein
MMNNSPSRIERRRRRLSFIIHHSSFIIFLFIIHHSSFIIPAAAVSNAGSTGAGFLELGIGARTAAMGGANVAWADDVYGFHYNPAGVARASRRSVGFVHNTLFDEMNYNYLGYLHPLSSNGVFGLSALYVDLGGVERTTVSSGLANTSLGRATGADLAVSISYAHVVSQFLDLGATVKGIHGRLDRYTATAAAVDLGARLHPGLPGLTIGGSISNLGTRLQYVRRRESLPLTLRLGAGYRPPATIWAVTGDLVWVREQDLEVKLGGEIWIWPRRFALRLGVDSANDLSKTGITLGAGFVWDDDLHLDYAFIPSGDLGNQHLMALAYQFGPARSPYGWDRLAEPVRPAEDGRRGFFVAPLIYRAGPIEVDWYGMATMEVLKHSWREYGLAARASQARYAVTGEYRVEGERLLVTVRVKSGEEIIETLEFQGTHQRPFPLWTRMTEEINRVIGVGR